MATGKEILEQMGIDLDEAIALDEEVRNRRPRDRRICLCGHGVSRHEELAGRESCSALGYNCKCRKVQPVLEVDDIRVFLSKTEGTGILHALNRGILSATKKGQNIQWIDGTRICHRCGTDEGRLTPTAVTGNGFPADHDTGYNAILCDTCRSGGQN